MSVLNYTLYGHCIRHIILIINRWENNLCPDCGAPIKTVDYVNKCSAKPNEHSLGDANFYLKKIKEVIEKCLI